MRRSTDCDTRDVLAPHARDTIVVARVVYLDSVRRSSTASDAPTRSRDTFDQRAAAAIVGCSTTATNWCWIAHLPMKGDTLEIQRL